MQAILHIMYTDAMFNPNTAFNNDEAYIYIAIKCQLIMMLGTTRYLY